MDERKVVKQTQKVVFGMSDRSKVKGEVFLGLYDAHHTGPLDPVTRKEALMASNTLHNFMIQYKKDNKSRTKETRRKSPQ